MVVHSFDVDISTFKGFLRTGKPNPSDLTRSLHSAITGISRYTVEGRDDELASFRESMLALAANIHDQANAPEVETCVGQALELFRDYNERMLKFNLMHTDELKSVMRTMTETITYLSESRTRSVHNLQFVSRELEQAAQIDDIRLLRTRILGCLDVVKEETVRLQSEAEARSQEVREQIGRAMTAIEAPPQMRFGMMDTVTGLPARRAAVKTISETMQSAGKSAIAVFVVTRLSAINSKYGRAVGDEVMLRVANHFAQHLSSDTLLYRWSGPALIALINIQDNGEAIHRAWAKASAIKQEISLETKERSVFVVVETSMSFQVITKTTVAQDLFHDLDRYVAEVGDSPGDCP
jgi:diguanylate cyclase (GGDEF)-like protein